MDWIGWIEYVFRLASPRLSNCSQLVKLDTTNKCGLSCEELHSYPFGYGVDSGSTVGSALYIYARLDLV